MILFAIAVVITGCIAAAVLVRRPRNEGVTIHDALACNDLIELPCPKCPD